MSLHLAIYGSPRINGFSSRAHDNLPDISHHSSVMKFRAFEDPVEPCTGCGVCATAPICPIQDSMQNIYRAIRDADSITISSPVYFSSVPGPLKNIIDRCQLFWEEKKRGIPMEEKTGTLILTAGSVYESPPAPALDVIRHFFNTINCGLDINRIYFISGTDYLSSEQGQSGIR